MANLDNFRLVVFRTVAEQHSFRKAAEELYLTQPAVSLQIKALEEELGAKLFDRTGAHVRLSPAGSVLLGYARRAHELLAGAVHEIAALNGKLAGKLALGASTTIAQYVLPRLLGEFSAEHPSVQAAMMSGNTEQIVHAVDEQKIALGFIEGPARHRDVRTEPFLRDELVLIVPSTHAWAQRAELTTAELASIPLLMRERGSGSRRIVEMALERHGTRRRSLNVAMELDSTEAIKTAVESGLGAGFVSRWAIAKDLRLGASFRIVEVAGLRIQRDFLIASVKGPELQGLAAEFRAFLLARSAAWNRPARSDAPRPAAAKRADKKPS